jgi:hypothetical protein
MWGKAGVVDLVEVSSDQFEGIRGKTRNHGSDVAQGGVGHRGHEDQRNSILGRHGRLVLVPVHTLFQVSISGALVAGV